MVQMRLAFFLALACIACGSPTELLGVAAGVEGGAADESVVSF